MGELATSRAEFNEDLGPKDSPKGAQKQSERSSEEGELRASSFCFALSFWAHCLRGCLTEARATPQSLAVRGGLIILGEISVILFQ